MPYEDLIVLIPSHSLEDFPAELGEDDGASLLNAFAVPWHPALLASARVLPRWNRADEPPEGGQRLIVVPTSCESWIPAGWADRVAQEGSTVVRGQSRRSDLLQTALAPLGLTTPVDDDLAADFLALGFCYLQVELLTRKMRHFTNLDEVHLQREAVAAAEAAMAHDVETARTRLRACFEVLREARERFYPVECYLIDLCLLVPQTADHHLITALQSLKPMSLLATGADLQKIAAENPAAVSLIREAWDRGAAEIVGGEWDEAPLPLWPLPSILWQFRHGVAAVHDLFHHRPATWGRRRFGLFPQLAQILKKSGFAAGLHVALDDGIYPDAEHSKLRWESADGTVLDALSRIPVAADSAASFLRFPGRMAESMDNDHVAAVIFARWPEVKSPWFDDLRRMHNYAPVLGRFVTLEEFFRTTETSTRHFAFRSAEYLSPYLFQSVARDEPNPISRYAAHAALRRQFDSGVWFSAAADLLAGRSPDTISGQAVEQALETLGEQPANADRERVESATSEFLAHAASRLAERILAGSTGNQPGYLVLNPLGFRRRVHVEIPPGMAQPQTPGENAWLQWTDRHRMLTLDVPGAGFAWVPAALATPAAPALESQTPLAEPNLLRNEFFEVRLSEETGGIRQIKGYGRSPNRLSQQINFRFARERTFTVGTGDEAQELHSHYAEMRVQSSEVLASGPALGEILTTGEIIDQKTGQRLAGFRQTCRVRRGRPLVELEIELDVARLPDPEPWHSYYAARFAWNDDSAALTRSVLLGAQEVPEERIESLHYLEIAAGDQRTTILPQGLPFHRKSGPRMIDTLLIAAGETRRKFQLAIAVDQHYPMQAALDEQTPPVILPTANGPPRSGRVGWFFHLDARSVQLLELLPPLSEPVEAVEPWAEPEPPATGAGWGCGVRLIETEGRPVQARLRCFRAPMRARQRNLLGKTINNLAIDGDAVIVDLSPQELADVELWFDDSGKAT